MIRETLEEKVYGDLLYAITTICRDSVFSNPHERPMLEETPVLQKYFDKPFQGAFDTDVLLLVNGILSRSNG